MVVGAKFREHVMKRFLICEVDFEAFEEKVELGECTLLLMKSSEFFKHEVGGDKIIDEINVHRGHAGSYETTKSTVIMPSDEVGLWCECGIWTGQ